MQKVKEWLWRYLPAEFFATIGAISGSSLLYLTTGNRIVAAYAGAIGENIGYYGFISIRDYKNIKQKYVRENKRFSIVEYFKLLRNLVIEFGFSEALDSLAVRPFCMYWFPVWLKNYTIGIFTGKLAADIVFYIPTIISYEIRKKLIKD